LVASLINPLKKNEHNNLSYSDCKCKFKVMSALRDETVKTLSDYTK